MRESVGRAAVAGLLLGLVGLLCGALVEAAPLFLASAVLAFVSDQVLLAAPNAATRLLARLQLGFAARTWLRGGLLFVGLAAMQDIFAGPAIVAAIVAVLALGLGNAVYSRAMLSLRQRADAEVAWRNVPVRGVTSSPVFREPVPARLGGDGVQLIAASEVLLLAGAGAAATARNSWWLVAGALATSVAVSVLVLLGLLAWRRMRARGPVSDANEAVRQAFQATRPEVVFYFSSPASGSYALAVWLDVLTSIRRPAAIILRERTHLSVLEGVTVPIVVLPTAPDVERFATPSMRVVLYPTNVIKNNHMVRLPGMRHCFIGHGDSDKAGSYSPVSRMYDEIWVAGQAGADRYAATKEGFREQQIRIVGRPQLAGIVQAQEPIGQRPVRVLYAPTWEGFFDQSDYSSLAGMGEQIVRALLDAGATVLFKPHPATGERLREATQASARIAHLLAASPGAGHEVVGTGSGSLYQAFNRADLLITDVSSLITDFLASRKPYIVTNPRQDPEDAFLSRFPSAAAAYLLDRDISKLAGYLRDAATVDSRRTDRLALARYLLGSGTEPLTRFLDEIEGCAQRAEDDSTGQISIALLEERRA
ncbi:MAG: hypothetical protein JWR33_1656 [Naasia sp.]|uniref:CDP-glycerol glycerophosphotransferase family protein n=1 Tax=Naasia sp. TaxID=2546198 RepID=UPI00262F665B|nr:CDP-glycerol glycerophosphotransferase family protein [Naasia sp.]MCU1570915.1 hypothetical protein [Naasia sp.]